MTSEFGASLPGEKLEVISEQLLSPITVRFLLPILNQSVTVLSPKIDRSVTDILAKLGYTD
jgi:hypothetical protein